ncbi:MAG: COR domain-containing protein, partial [Pseudomonadota bacterium]
SLRFSSVKGLPSELYTGGALHRDAFKAYLDDLATAGAEARPRVKMIILGNGEVGKTQLRRRLQGEEFNPVWDSTHGIEAHSAHMDHPDYPKGVLINAWDFGGQDIYHGAHALFMRSNAVVVLCWHPDFEAGVEATSGELGIERKPLTYWLDFIAHTAGRDVPLILVRTRGRDRKAGEMLPDGASERLAQFAHAREAVIDTGEPPQNLDQFREQLRDAIGHLDAQFGAVHIGQSRMELAMGLAAMRESDQHYTDPAHKRFRTLTQERYAQYCETRLAPVSSPKHALDFLHHAGDVFYQEGLFDDRIVLDHNWALGAVYAVFNRSEKLVNELRRRGGRFTRDFLALALWDRAGHSEADQSLFLSMMVQCGIAFRASGKRSDDADAEYIAPALLPKLGETQTQFKDRWEDASPSAQTLARYGRIHAGFVHRLIAKYGELTEGQAIYWDTGVLIFDEETQARGRVDVDVEAGTVTLRTQPGLSGRGDTARLIKRLSEVRERVDRHFNLSPEIEGAVEVLEDQEQSPDSARLVAGFEPAPRPRFAISYAHPDRDAGETEIYEKIEALKPLIEERGWEFIYDQRDLPAGTDLPGFMKTISAADRVLTVFSPKYFRSRFCTSELIGAWDWSREDPRVFQSSVIAIGHPEIVLDDTGFWTNTHQHWATLAEELIQQVASTADVEGTSPLAGRKDLLLKFRRQIIPVLESLSSIIQPMSFDAFIERLDYYVPRHTK